MCRTYGLDCEFRSQILLGCAKGIRDSVSWRIWEIERMSKVLMKSSEGRHVNSCSLDSVLYEADWKTSVNPSLGMPLRDNIMEGKL